ncbi:outer membrane protein assembly factor BamA [Cephaloticoccus capnophilus]|uniref:Outer membrane protein assembly factor BamA n=1 Tax=Cephaloticoccus capnophilus TaxID=1548208 RepID=A0A139SJ23_9BACT|nr:outer membrane protein assembly factor BamA [Cephaloticoccus capnophilus]
MGFAGLASSPLVVAQPFYQGEGREGQPEIRVGEIAVRFLGIANVSEEVVRANMQIREGRAVDDTMIDRDIRALYRTGLFEFIEVKREALPGNVFNLVVEVTPKYRVMSVSYRGNRKIKDNRLDREIKTRANASLDERQIKEDSEKIREHYQKEGYNQVSVTYAIERDRATGFGAVIFNIREGNRSKIGSIRFVGNDNIKSRKLRKAMDTRKWWWLSWLTGKGRFKDDAFEEDLDKLRDYYREEGYLDVEILPENISFSYPSPKKLLITIAVDEGRQYRIGEVEVTNATIYPPQLLKRLLRQRTGMVYSPSKLDKDVERLEDAYGTAGYLDTRVRMIRKPNITTGDIDLEYEIEESEKFSVESIAIEGNTKTKSVVILRELVLGPGDVYDTVREKISKLRLDNTRFFEDVQLSPQETNIPGRRNLRVAVREARTGNLTFGAGFSSLDRATVFAEVSQGNFDLFNYRSFFQGDGQKFRLRMQLGSRSSEALLSFEEPWLFERQLAMGFTLYRTSSEYNSDYYNQIASGGEVYLRKRLFELVDGRLSYTYEVVEIKDVTSEGLTLVQPGRTEISRVGLQILRDTRDKIIGTTTGNRVELNIDVAGGPFGGNVDYYKLDFRGAQYYPTFEFQNQVMSVMGRAGVIDSYGDSTSVPYYYSFFLGGPYTLRGFEYNDVAPRNSAGLLRGGKSYGMLSLEYSMDVVNPIRIAAFYDAGFVNPGAYDFNPSGLHDNIGVGIQLFVAGAPLRLDYGIPLSSSKQADKGGQFNFSFGTRF